jgi:hypothetical protein
MDDQNLEQRVKFLETSLETSVFLLTQLVAQLARSQMVFRDQSVELVVANQKNQASMVEILAKYIPDESVRDQFLTILNHSRFKGIRSKP